MTGVSLRKHLQTLLEARLLPAARAGAPLVLLESPVFTVTAVDEHQNKQGEVTVTSTPARPLPRVKSQRSHIALHYWPEYFLNALRVPYLACVFEGEADITTALTQEQARQYCVQRDGRGKVAFARQTVAIREPGFFLVPPGAPVSYGPRPHWERPEPHKAYSRIFWIHLLPAGVLCHTCSSSRGRHRTNPYVFVANDRLPLLSELLQNEVRRREQHQPELVRLLLTSLLLKLSDALGHEKSLLVSTGQAIEAVAAQRPGSLTASQKSPVEDGIRSATLRRALQFIEANLNKTSLNPVAIADHSYVSVSHLNRLFQAEMSTPVMEYVTGQRLRKARSLLAQTNIPVAEVADLCGYANPSHFSQLFARYEGRSPRAYRTGHQKQEILSTGSITPQ